MDPVHERPSKAPKSAEREKPIKRFLENMTPEEAALLEGLADLDRKHGNEPTLRK